MFTVLLTVLLSAVLMTGCTGNPASANAPKLEKYSATTFDYFDTVSTLIGYDVSQEAFDENWDYVLSEMERYDKLYDIYHTYSGITNLKSINKHAAEAPMEVDPDIIALLKFGKEIYEKTGGMTNMAMGSVLRIWHNHREDANYDPALASVPDPEELEEAYTHCDIDDVVIDEEAGTVFFKDPLLTLDVGAIAKGYATERIAEDLIEKGVNLYTLNFGGNIRTIGTKDTGEDWVAGIQNPDLQAETAYIETVKIHDKALVTSGCYQRYFVVDGKRYHHIIDPHTLMPNDTFAAVSIIGPDSGVADALSTACFNLSYEEGRALIDAEPETEALWVTPDGKVLYSAGFESYIK